MTDLQIYLISAMFRLFGIAIFFYMFVKLIAFVVTEIKRIQTNKKYNSWRGIK